jgi:hypothetical protein
MINPMTSHREDEARRAEGLGRFTGRRGDDTTPALQGLSVGRRFILPSDTARRASPSRGGLQ